MKTKILLLSLATLLLGACQSEDEPTETFYLQQKPESMEERNELVTSAAAAMIQTNAPRYNCEIVGIALVGGDMVRIRARGAKEDLDALFDMEERNEIVTSITAGLIQINASRYNCEIIEVEYAGGDMVRIRIRGAKKDLDILFNMDERNELVTGTMAAMIQTNASRYNCEVVQIALAGGDMVKICVRGSKKDLDALFDYVNEAGKE